ncbi:MAG TPA: VIT family protein [Acidimicrobiales bacterium]|nr:VIT family protein [Acidimicrobiales bacterium]
MEPFDPVVDPAADVHAEHGHHHLEDHRSGRAGWLRAAVLGANDGILSTASLLAGMVGSGAAFDVVRTAGIAGMVAGATSMAAGEYVSVSSQRDVEQADLALEAAALELHPRAELAELTEIWRRRGLDPDLAAQVAEQLTEADALAAHARDELGITEVAEARPLQAAVTSFLAFCLGALLPILAYVVAPAAGRYAAVTGGALVFLALLGAVGAALGGAPRLRAMARVAIGGAVAMAVTTGIGELTGAALG